MSDIAHQLIPLILKFSSCKPDCLYNIVVFSVDHFQAVSNTSSPGNTGIHKQYTVHVSVRVYSTFAHSVGNGLLCTSLGNTISI